MVGKIKALIYIVKYFQPSIFYRMFTQQLSVLLISCCVSHFCQSSSVIPAISEEVLALGIYNAE